MIEQNESH